MSTRGVIAKPYADGWAGTYQHFDSYPTGLGKKLWAILHGGLGSEYPQNARDCHLNVQFATVDELLAFALDFEHGGWSSFPSCCYHHWRPEEDEPLTELIQAPCCGGGDGMGCTEETCDPLMLEWVYILSGQTMTVLGHYSIPDETVSYRSRYAHRVVAQVDLAGAEPDWQLMQDEHSAAREGMTLEEYRVAYAR